MGFWGGTIGGIAGFALGGPLGAILGAVVGNTIGNMASGASEQSHSREELQLAFSTALVVLSAKMAKADGRVTRDEIDTFKRVFSNLFQAADTDMHWAGQIFNEARNTADGFEPYAQQIARLVPPQVLEELLFGLLLIAQADGTVHPAEREFLRKVAAIFGFSEQQFQRVLHRGGSGNVRRPGKAEPNPYDLLGIPRKSTNAEVKAAYRKLARENHPDLLASKGLPEEMLEQANDKMALINRAYDRISKERGI